MDTLVIEQLKDISGGNQPTTTTHDPSIKYVGGGITNPSIKVADNINIANTDLTVSPYVVVSPNKPVQGGGINFSCPWG